ncbi:MAG: thymidine kinase [Bacteroidota bacterium]|jgi:thymidine kinase
MFIEPTGNRGRQKGWIEVVCGCMFSGKTEELIRRLKRARFAHQRVEIFKPMTDVRYHEQNIVSHDATEIRSTPVDSSLNILLMAGDAEVIGIDEAQFFDSELPNVCAEMAARGIRVIVAGLDMDYRGQPFGPMPNLMAKAEFVTKVHAICMKCGDLATHSFRTSQQTDQVLLGEKDNYEPRCRRCFNEDFKP